MLKKEQDLSPIVSNIGSVVGIEKGCNIEGDNN